MSWPTGYCGDCGECSDYKYSHGYEKPHGLSKGKDGKMYCDECITKRTNQTAEGVDMKNKSREMMEKYKGMTVEQMEMCCPEVLAWIKGIVRDTVCMIQIDNGWVTMMGPNWYAGTPYWPLDTQLDKYYAAPVIKFVEGMEDEIKQIISDAFSEYQGAYSRDSIVQPYPRDQFPDVCAYSAFKVVEFLKVRNQAGGSAG